MISRKLLWALCFSSYIFYAITATEIGSALPGIRSELALSESLAGIIASLQSLMIMGLGALLISGSPSALILGASFFIIGAGIGFFEASVNAFVSDIFSERRGMAINLLHIGWNIGSALGPVLAAYIALSYGSWRVGYLMMSPLLLASFAANLITGIKLGKNKSSTSCEPRSIKPKQVLSILLLMMIPFLIVANQLGITTWLPSILSDQGASLIEASLAVGLFWGLSGLGRLLWAPFIDRNR